MTAPLSEGLTNSQFPWTAAQMAAALRGTVIGNERDTATFGKVADRLSTDFQVGYPELVEQLGKTLVQRMLDLNAAVRAYSDLADQYGIENVFYGEQAPTSTPAEQLPQLSISPAPESLE